MAYIPCKLPRKAASNAIPNSMLVNKLESKSSKKGSYGPWSLQMGRSEARFRPGRFRRRDMGSHVA